MTKEKIYVPPIKIQGKKTLLVDFITKNLPCANFDTWIEPFMGSGVVGFNIQHPKAIFADTNPHIINFYNAIKNNKITNAIAKEFLQQEGRVLSEKGQEYYNIVRERFNTFHDSLDFLFLNRSCFNGMIRFNRKLKFNVPFGHKPDRFAQAYVTKITNQIKQVEFFIKHNDWNFICQDFRTTIQNAKNNDFIYCDPPYIGRHVDYFDSWDEANEIDLQKYLHESQSNFIVSTWHSNHYRKNTYLPLVWSDYKLVTTTHFYHLGAKEENRNPIIEALIVNYEIPKTNELKTKEPISEQLSLL